MDKNILIPAMITNGKYKNRIGKATLLNSYGNVMFYPKEGKNPYRVCLKATEVEYVN